MALDNKSLGKFILDGIPPAPRGIPQIEVTFDIDADGILNVGAKDRATGREQHITIQPSSGLADEEIEQMVQEAEQHAADDKERKEAVSTRNWADSTIYSAERLFRDHGDRISAEEKERIEAQMAAVREASSGQDLEAIRTAAQALQTAVQTASASFYEEAPQTEGEGPEDVDADDQVIDGEHEQL